MFERSSVNRRTVIKTVGAAGVVGLAGCTGDDGGDGSGDDMSDEGGDDSSNGDTTGDTDEDTEVRFVLNPAESDVDISEQYRPMFEHIESSVDGVTVEAVETSSYTATFQEIRRDGAEVADVSPTASVVIEDVADIIGIRVAFGAAQYFSLITTTPDENGVDALTELEGEEVAMGAPLSTSGTLVPLTILQDAGLDVGTAPDGDPPDFEAQYSDHSTAREQVINNPEVRAATTGAFSTAPHVPQEQFDEMSQDFVEISSEYDGAGEATDEAELKLLAVSDPLPRAPLVTRSNWEADVRDPVEEAILAAEPEDLAHEEDYDGEELWFTGVEAGSFEDFEPIRQIFDQLEVEFEDLQ